MNCFSRCFVLSLSIFIPLLATGCKDKGPVTYPVTGTVYLDDQPLTGARVIFSPKSTGKGELDASGKTDANGVFMIQTTLGKPDGGTTPGEYVVAFSKMKEVWDGKSYLTSSTPGVEPIKNSRSFEALNPLYTSQRTSPVTATVTKDKKANQFDFRLKSKP